MLHFYVRSIIPVWHSAITSMDRNVRTLHEADEEILLRYISLSLTGRHGDACFNAPWSPDRTVLSPQPCRTKPSRASAKSQGRMDKPNSKRFEDREETGHRGEAKSA